MSFFSSVVSIGKMAIQRMQGPSDPNLVKSVSSAELAPLNTQDRHGPFALVGPRTVPAAKKGDPDVILYEIIVHAEKSNNSYSVQRIIDLDVAKATFANVSEKLSPILEIQPELFSQANLQLLSDALRKNPSLSPCHLAVMFDLRKAIEKADIMK